MGSQRVGHDWETFTSLYDMLLLLLLSRFSRVQLCVTPQMAAHQAPPSLGFSRQEHWSGLPFPSPMHEGEKWKWSRSVSVRLFMTPWTAAHQAAPSMGFSRQEYWTGRHCLIRHYIIWLLPKSAPNFFPTELMWEKSSLLFYLCHHLSFLGL